MIGPLSLLALSACVEKAAPPPKGGQTERAVEVSFSTPEEAVGLQIRLSDADPEAASTEASPAAQTTPLSPAETERLLARLPALEEDGAAAAFALRERSLPPPRAGETVAMAFPPEPDDRPPEIAPGPLEVLRYAPEGAVAIAPHLSVTFSRPLVALTGQDDAARSVPVRLSPEPPGQWRWLGTRTVVFEPDPEELIGEVTRDAPRGFPKATRYTVEVPAGTAPVDGGEPLSEAISWSFETPAPTLQWAWPEYGPHPLELPVLLGFDQRVDAEALLPFVSLSDGRRQVPLRVASLDEIAPEAAQRLAEQALPGRVAAYLPTEPLSPDAQYTLAVAAGAPSAEGPLTTGAAQSRSFYTYPPLSLGGTSCERDYPCEPYGGFSVYFNNPLEPGTLDLSKVRVEPPLELSASQISGSAIYFQAPVAGRTTYKVTIPAGLTDTFGQSLERPVTAEVVFGPATPTLEGPGKDLVVLDPAADPALSIFSRNHSALVTRIWSVTPADWPAIQEWYSRYYYNEAGASSPPARLLTREVVEVASREDERVETTLDLSPWLDSEGHGQLLVEVEPVDQPEEYWRRQRVLVWVQATDLGLAAVGDYDSLTAWTSELATGAAAEGVQIAISPGELAATSGGDGLAQLSLSGAIGDTQVLTARRGGDVAMLPCQPYFWGSGACWYQRGDGSGPVWYVFDDRQLYKPGETVTVKGWIRWADRGRGGDLRAMDPAPSKVRWILYGPQYNKLDEGEAEIAGLGGFDLQVPLPGTANLGYARLELTTDGGGYYTHSFQIQEFRRPEFEVAVSGSEGPHVLGERATATVSASYYAGGGLQAAPVTWSVVAQPGSWRPPGFEGYSFGSWTPWWGGWWAPVPSAPVTSYPWSATTDAAGQHALSMHFEALSPPRTMSVRAEATVIDVNRQAWSAASDLVVHPSATYVGLKTGRAFYQEGDEVEVSLVVSDLEGQPVAGAPIALTMARMEWGLTGGVWTELPKDEERCEVESAAEPVTCSFTPGEGGRHRLLARVSDGEGRPSESELSFWIAGGDARPQRGVVQEQVQLIPDADSYQPGDTAEILLQAPFAPAEALVTWQRGGVVRTERLSLETTQHTLRVPIEEGHIPGLYLGVELMGSAERTDAAGAPLPDAPRRPAFASGSLRLPVPPLPRTLSVAVQPAVAALAPGGETPLTVTVTGPDGAPVAGAEVAIVAVDEAVLSLTGYRLPDPLDTFYSDPGYGGGTTWWLHHQIWLARSELLATSSATPTGDAAGDMLGDFDGRSAGFGGGGAAAGNIRMEMDMAPSAEPMAASAPMEGLAKLAAKPAERSRNGHGDKDRAGGESAAPIALRSDFGALALFAPAERTGADGAATVTLALPDSLTRYRVMAVAVAGADRFGAGEADVTARKPLMVRPSPPRFLNFGDRFELALVVQNQTDEAMEVQLAARAANARFVDATAPGGAVAPSEGSRSAGVSVTVPANDRVEVRLPAATTAAGEARFQVAASAGAFADAASFELPVWTPATTEAFATYGELDQGAIAQPLEVPAGAVTQFGGLSVTTSSTQLQALTDALIYLSNYPFACSEQLASRVLGVAALRDVLEAFEAPDLQEPAALDAAVAEALERLAARQNYDGGWAWWRRGDPSDPFVSVHVAHSLGRAKARGYPVPEGTLSSARAFLSSIEQHIPADWSQYTRWQVRAYALYALHHMGATDPRKAAALYREAGVDGLSLESIGFLLPSLAGSAELEAALRHLENRVTETAGAANFVTQMREDAHLILASDRRADGVILEGLIEVRPASDLIPKVVRGLLAHRVRGRWGNTQENAFVLLALDRYFAVYEAQVPAFTARAWIGDDLAGEHRFEGRTTERAQLEVPMAWLADAGQPLTLTLGREGQGRMYYRLGMQYAPADLKLAPADRGFVVDRVYEAVDDPDDVTLDADGVWTVRAGARVRVKLTMVAPSRRYHVALVDPLPAGFEALNPALATTGALPDDAGGESAGPYWWWYRPWFEHQNLRDERAEVFTRLLWGGVHSYTYYARATTPGRFVVPPVKAEEMYSPETFGRGGTDTVIVAAP